LLETELAARVKQGAAQSAELAASRRRLLGVEDEARERLADAIRRDVVSHLAVVDAELTASPAADHYDAGSLELLIGATERAQQELRTVCRGVFPALLDRRGLVPALSAQLDLTHPHTVLDVDANAQRRLDRAVEAAGYLFCVEVAPMDRSSLVTLLIDDGQLVATVTGDLDWEFEPGRTDRAENPVDWQHSRDRVAALDGSVEVQCNESCTTVTAVIPLDPERDGARSAAG
jgi:signal transduction histidine kinase